MPGTDDWVKLACQHRHEIVLAYSLWSKTKPIVLYHVQEQRIYVYPYEEFKNDLNARSQAILETQYRQAVHEDKIVVFVRDNDRQRFVSFSMSQEADDEQPSIRSNRRE